MGAKISADEAKACVDELYRWRTFARLASCLCDLFEQPVDGDMTGKDDDSIFTLSPP
jgi:hypothetical protein